MSEKHPPYVLDKTGVSNPDTMKTIGLILDELVLISSYPMLRIVRCMPDDDKAINTAKNVSMEYFRWMAFPAVVIIFLNEQDRGGEIDNKRLWETCSEEYQFIWEVINKVATEKTKDFFSTPSNSIH